MIEFLGLRYSLAHLGRSKYQGYRGKSVLLVHHDHRVVVSWENPAFFMDMMLYGVAANGSSPFAKRYSHH